MNEFFNLTGRESARLLSERLTNGNNNALGRLFGVRQSTVRRWLAGTAEISSIAVLLLAVLDVLAEKIGENSACEVVLDAARRLGREPDDKRK